MGSSGGSGERSPVLLDAPPPRTVARPRCGGSPDRRAPVSLVRDAELSRFPPGGLRPRLVCRTEPPETAVTPETTMNVHDSPTQPRTLVRDATDLGMFLLALTLIGLMAILALATLREQT